MNIGDRQIITIVAVPEAGAKDGYKICDECVFSSRTSCDDIECNYMMFVPEEMADEYIARAVRRRME